MQYLVHYLLFTNVALKHDCSIRVYNQYLIYSCIIIISMAPTGEESSELRMYHNLCDADTTTQGIPLSMKLLMMAGYNKNITSLTG